MDVKIHYKLSTRYQIINLFKRFFTITVPLPASAAKATEAAENNETKPEGEVSEKAAPSDSLTPPPTPPLQAAQVPKAAFAGDDEDGDDEDETVLDIDNAITPPVLPPATVQRLAEQFADAVPANKYSMAELQGYLLTVRTKPYEAVANVGQWMIEMAEEKVRIQQKEADEKEERKKEWMKKKKEEEEKKKKEKGSSSGSTTEQEESDDEGKAKKKSKSKKSDEGAKEETPAPTPAPTTTTEEKAAESEAKETAPPPAVDVVPEEAPATSDKGAEEVGSGEGVTTKAEEST